MTDDLIRRADLLELYDDPEHEFDGYVVPFPVVRQNVLDMPAVDAVEVVHAHWEDANKSVRGKNSYAFNWWCSSCGKPQNSPVAKNWEEFTKSNPYCHTCGAHMDGRRWDPRRNRKRNKK